MDDSTLRELARELHDRLPEIIPDDEERDRAAHEIEAALAEPEGSGMRTLLTVLRARDETRTWMAVNALDESTLRELARQLHDRLGEGLIPDDEERGHAALEIEAALTESEGSGVRELRTVLCARPETRSWMAANMGWRDVLRAIPGLPGTPTTPLGVRVVCPRGDYDRYLESPTDDPGRCPNDGSRLVRTAD